MKQKKAMPERARRLCCFPCFFFDLLLPRSLLPLPHLFRSRNHGGEAHSGDTPSELARSATGLFLEKRVIKKKERKKKGEKKRGGSIQGRRRRNAKHDRGDKRGTAELLSLSRASSSLLHSLSYLVEDGAGRGLHRGGGLAG